MLLRTHLGDGADGTTRFGHDDSSAKSKKRNVPSHVQTYGKEKKTNEQNPSKKERKIQFRKREVTQTEHSLFLFLCKAKIYCIEQDTMSEFITPVFASFASSFVIALSSLRNDTTTKGRLDYVSTKTSVGTKFCMLSVLVLAFRNTWIIKGSNFIQKSAEFHALANLAGYVVFDLVFSCIFCCQLKWHSILENILTLATFYTALEKWEEYDVASSQYIKPIIVSWSVYKILKGVVESPIIDEAEKNVVKTSKEKLALWTIHGQDYDLESFVNSHPGGKEAILIGRGRDCTALFESYHPFTDRHR